MTLEVIKQNDTPTCIYTNFKQDGIEWCHCLFKDMNHPVNRKAAEFKMSGAEQ